MKLKTSMLIAVAGCVFATSVAHAQSPSGSNPPSSRKDAPAKTVEQVKPIVRPAGVLRRPLIDLEALAKARRDGQVMPGDIGPMPAAGASQPAAPITESVKVSKTAPVESKGSLERAAPPAPAATTTSRVEVARSNDPASDADELPAVPAVTTEVVQKPARDPAIDAIAKPAAVNVEEAPRTSARIEETRPHIAALRTTPATPVTDAPASGQATPSTPVMPAPVKVASLGPAKVTPLRTSGGEGTEWRFGAEAWSSVPMGKTVDSRVEVRAGLDGDVTFDIDGHAQVRVSRLARVAIERAMETDGSSSVHLTLTRGLIEVRGTAAGHDGWAAHIARIKTPDRMLLITGPSSIEYDAFSGTKVRLLSDK